MTRDNHDPGDLTSRGSDVLGRPRLGGGRLGTYTLIGAATGAVPLPWLPGAVGKRVRGALLHDIASRHGVSLTPEARKVLVDPPGEGSAKSYLKQGAGFLLSRVLGRIGPFAAVSPIRSALGTFVLGHLFHRYLELARTVRSVRMDAEEARRLREAIDRSILQALTTDPRPSREDGPFAPEDLREQGTAVVDGVIIGLASVPDWLVRRLDAAFDEVIVDVRP